MAELPSDMRKILILIAFWAGPQVQGFGQEEQGFEAAGDDGPVRVYTRSESNNDMSVLVTTSARATVSAVRTIIANAPAYPTWVHRCEEAYVLSGGTDSAYTYYSRIKLPFPFQDREIVADISEHNNLETGVLTRRIISRPDAVPLTKGVERIQAYPAVWTLAPAANNTVDITCLVRTAAGGGLPAWLRREIMTGGPLKTIQNLIRLVER
jgi:hypothetical protein